ncbi:MAG: aminomethyltransferase family protein [Paracoccaceae bacterium]
MAKRTSALEDIHIGLGAGLGPWNDMEVPWSYTNPAENQLDAMREAAGLFDLTGLKKIWVKGPDAPAVIDMVSPRDMSKVTKGKAAYCPILTDEGTICDDVIIYRIEDDKYLFVYGTGAGDERLALAAKGKNVKLEKDDELHTLSLQGPKAVKLLDANSPANLAAVDFFGLVQTELFGHKAIVSRTGYSGERGYEIFVDRKDAVAVWNGILKAGEKDGVVPCSFTCLNKGRMEAGLLFYPFDMDDKVTPWEMGLGWAISRKKPAYLGREAVLKQEGKEKVKLTGISCTSSKGIIEGGTDLFLNGEKVGAVTSSEYSHRLGRSLALVHIRPGIAEGTKLKLGNAADAVDVTVEDLPFYDKEKKRMRM